MNYLFNLSEPLVIPRKKISTFMEPGCVSLIYGSVGTCCPKDWFTGFL